METGCSAMIKHVFVVVLFPQTDLFSMAEVEHQVIHALMPVMSVPEAQHGLPIA